MHECRLCSDFFMGIKIPLKFAFSMCSLVVFKCYQEGMGFNAAKALNSQVSLWHFFFCEEYIFSFLSSTGQNILVIYFI